MELLLLIGVAILLKTLKIYTKPVKIHWLEMFYATLCVATAAFIGSCRAIQIPRVPGQKYGTLARTRARPAAYTRQVPPALVATPADMLSPLVSDIIIGGSINGDHSCHPLLEVLELEKTSPVVANNEEGFLPEAPAMSYGKFLTMQDKRAVVTIRYSGDAGLKPYFLTVAKKVKASHPDVVIERRILPAVADGESTFEVLVDGKVVLGKSRPRKLGRGSDNIQQQGGRRSVFVSMGELDLAISRARRKNRPNTSYGDHHKTNNGGSD